MSALAHKGDIQANGFTDLVSAANGNKRTFVGHDLTRRATISFIGLLAAMFFVIHPRPISRAALDHSSNRRADEATWSRCHSAIMIVCGEGGKSEAVLSAQNGGPRPNRRLPRR